MALKKSSFKAISLVTLLLVLPKIANAFDFHISELNFTQVKRTFYSKTSIPMANYLGFGFSAPEVKLSFESHFQVDYDYMFHNNETELYDAYLHADKLWDMVSIDAGRQFWNVGFEAAMVDGLRFYIAPPGYLDIELFGGILRSAETGDFKNDGGLDSGINFNLKNVLYTNASVGMSWRKIKLDQARYNRNDSILARASASHGFSLKGLNPYVYGIFEYDVSGTTVDTATVGTTLYPHWRVSFNLEGSYLNENRSLGRVTVLSFFANDRVLQGRAGVTVKIIDPLSFIGNYSYQQYKPKAGLFTRTNIADVGFTSSIPDIGLTAHLTYMLRKSYGGKAQGGLFGVREDFTDRLYAATDLNYVKYNKITNDNDWAISSITQAGFEVMKGLLIAAFFEFNRNDMFNRDIRGTLQLQYVFDSAKYKKKES